MCTDKKKREKEPSGDNFVFSFCRMLSYLLLLTLTIQLHVVLHSNCILNHGYLWVCQTPLAISTN